MAWTTPVTWTAGQIVGASDLNAQIRDNELYLLSGRPLANVLRDNNANYTTTSTTFVDIDATHLIATQTITSGRVLIIFTCTVNPNPNTMAFDFTVDGTRIGAGGTGGLAIHTNGASGLQTVTIHAIKTGLSAASHTFKPQWLTSAGTGTLYSGSGVANTDCLPAFTVLEI